MGIQHGGISTLSLCCKDWKIPLCVSMYVFIAAKLYLVFFLLALGLLHLAAAAKLMIIALDLQSCL